MGEGTDAAILALGRICAFSQPARPYRESLSVCAHRATATCLAPDRTSQPRGPQLLDDDLGNTAPPQRGHLHIAVSHALGVAVICLRFCVSICHEHWLRSAMRRVTPAAHFGAVARAMPIGRVTLAAHFGAVVRAMPSSLLLRALVSDLSNLTCDVILLISTVLPHT